MGDPRTHDHLLILAGGVHGMRLKRVSSVGWRDVAAGMRLGYTTFRQVKVAPVGNPGSGNWSEAGQYGGAA